MVLNSLDTKKLFFSLPTILYFPQLRMKMFYKNNLVVLKCKFSETSRQINLLQKIREIIYEIFTKKRISVFKSQI